MPQHYKKRPVTVEAAQWDGTPADAEALIQWMSDTTSTNATYLDATPQTIDGDGRIICEAAAPRIAIETREGTVNAAAGDYIIRGTAGEFYPCKPSIFTETYEDTTDA